MQDSGFCSTFEAATYARAYASVALFKPSGRHGLVRAGVSRGAAGFAGCRRFVRAFRLSGVRKVDGQ
eukprot:scaffold2660_cov257-Pinguiococcus_pyrenoidosus.AAC.17